MSSAPAVWGETKDSVLRVANHTVRYSGLRWRTICRRGRHRSGIRLLARHQFSNPQTLEDRGPVFLHHIANYTKTHPNAETAEGISGSAFPVWQITVRQAFSHKRSHHTGPIERLVAAVSPRHHDPAERVAYTLRRAPVQLHKIAWVLMKH